MTPLEHAQTVTRYYERAVQEQEGSRIWRETGLSTARWYLLLAEKDVVTIKELDALLAFLEDNVHGTFGGSVWYDMLMGVRTWRRRLQP
jgi:hypothetical protein